MESKKMSKQFNFPIIDFTKSSANSIDAVGRTFSIRRPNGQKGDALGDKLGWIAHWSACPESLVFDDYHINICVSVDRKKPVIAKTLKFNQKGQHLFGRNTGMLAISFACPAVSKITKPTEEMVDAMALVIAESCAWHKLDPNGSIQVPKKLYSYATDKLSTLPGTIKMPVISDHASYAKADGYGRDRIDIGAYLPLVKSKALVFFKELKANERQFELVSILKG